VVCAELSGLRGDPQRRATASGLPNLGASSARPPTLVLEQRALMLAAALMRHNACDAIHGGGLFRPPGPALRPQVILRWRRLSDRVSREGAIMDRAVRMYKHRVVGATLRAVLQASAAVHSTACARARSGRGWGGVGWNGLGWGAALGAALGVGRVSGGQQHQAAAAGLAWEASNCKRARVHGPSTSTTS